MHKMKEVCGSRKKVVVCNFKTYDLSDSCEDYIERLKTLSQDFLVILAPPFTDIRTVRN